MENYYVKDTYKYGVPEQKKFPLPDADHVRSAIKFFNYVEPRYEVQLARAILKRAREYNVDLSEISIGDNNRFKKYIPNELKHHGILGQKWGVRRFQNEDGSYTAAGKERYGIGDKIRIIKEANKYGHEQSIKNRINDDKELDKKQKKIENDYKKFINGDLTKKQEKEMYEKYKKYDYHHIGDLNSADIWDNAIADADPRYNRATKSSTKYAKEYVKEKYNLDYDKLQKDTEPIALGASIIGTMAIGLLILTASGEIDWKS